MFCGVLVMSSCVAATSVAFPESRVAQRHDDEALLQMESIGGSSLLQSSKGVIGIHVNKTEGSRNQCADVPGWVDRYGRGCQNYGPDTYWSCDFNGRYAANGYRAETACCSCGGGLCDNVEGWVDKYGYGCKAYLTKQNRHGGRCDSGHVLAANGHSASTACRHCGGGTDRRRPKPAPTPKPTGEVPKCEGCGARPMECWNPCGGSRGYCDACNSNNGTRGACCRIDGRVNGVVHGFHDPDDPRECHSIPVQDFQHSDYHVCVLDKRAVPSQKPTADEVPKCEGCGARPMECWGTCGGRRGVCDACNSIQGTRGACCRVDVDGFPDISDPYECRSIPVSGFKYFGYHMCVLSPA